MKHLPWLFVGIFYIPLILMVLLSFNTGAGDRFIDLRTLAFKDLTFSNYATMASRGILARWFANTIAYAAIMGLGAAFLGIAGAFAMLRMSKRMRAFSLAILALSMVVPTTVVIIPLFLEIHYLHLTGLPAVILKGLATPSGIIIAWQLLKGVPDGYFEAATMDGANDLQMIWYIIIPICKPVFALIAITGAVGSTVDYLWQSVNLISPKVQTVLVAFTNQIWTSMFVMDTGANRLNIQMAMGVTMLAPAILIFMLGRKQLMNYTTEGGLKE